jgi:hypothetical protein
MEDAERVLTALAGEGGEVEVTANRDPQWNDATAAAKHRQDLARLLCDAADLERDPGEVASLLEEMAERDRLELSVGAEGAVVRRTDTVGDGDGGSDGR